MMKKFIGTIIVGTSLLFSVSTGYTSPKNPAVVPGSNVRGFVLGMTRQQVFAMAPNDERETKDYDHLVYENPKTGNTLQVWFKHGKAVYISYTSASFDTNEDITIMNFSYSKHASLFTIKESEWTSNGDSRKTEEIKLHTVSNEMAQRLAKAFSDLIKSAGGKAGKY